LVIMASETDPLERKFFIRMTRKLGWFKRPIVQRIIAQMLLCFMIEKRLVQMSRLHNLAYIHTEFADTNKDVTELAAKIQKNFKELGV